MKAVVAAFNQEKALVGAFSVITNLRMIFGWNFLKHYLAPGHRGAAAGAGVLVGVGGHRGDQARHRHSLPHRGYLGHCQCWQCWR